MQLFVNTNYDFMGKRKLWYGISIIVILVCLASIVISGGLNYSIDFSGGLRMEIKPVADSSGNHLSLADIRDALSSGGIHNVAIQEFPKTNSFVIMSTLDRVLEEAVEEVEVEVIAEVETEVEVEVIAEEEAEVVDVVEADSVVAEVAVAPVLPIVRTGTSDMVANDIVAVLRAVYPEQTSNRDFIQMVEEVGPRAGKDLRKQAVNAVLISMGLIAIYIWIRFRFAWGFTAALALFHDVIIALGVLSITGFEVGMTVLAALLTIVGYSINNSIVIYDRIRENLKLYRKDDEKDVINRSINDTLSRTVITSFTTLLACLALLIFGGEVIRGFALTFMVGIIVGTFSSLCIATSLVLDIVIAIKNRKSNKK